MMKIGKITFILIFFMAISKTSAFSQKNIYGDYLLASSEKTVSLDLKGARLLDVLKMLSQQLGLNFVSTEAVKERKLTLYLDKVPLKEAMDIIFEANNLAYDYFPEANIFVVKEMGKPTLELKSKVYHLKYARLASSNVQRQIEGTIGAAAASGIKEAIESVLSEFGKVTEDPLSNSLIVVDVPSQFPVIDEMIKKLDIPKPKVMIEVEMLDVSKKATEEFGIKWESLTSQLASLNITGQRKTAFPFWGQRAASEGGGRFGLSTLTIIGQQLTLKFYKDRSDTKTLARPRILTLSSETAEIKITTNEVVGLKRSESQQGTQVNFTPEREETGTSLRVTPQVDADTGNITLAVEIIVKDAKASGFTAGSSAFIQGTLTNPEERSTRAVARLKDGETLLIGGLIKNDVTGQRQKIPLLGDMPLLGRFFRWRKKEDTQRELLVFLTPHIIKERPWLTAGEKGALYREQVDTSKRKAVKVALDEFLPR